MGVKLPQMRTITIEIDTSIAGEILAWNLIYLRLLTNDLLLFYVILRFSRSYFHFIDFHDILNFDPIVRWTVNLESSSEQTQGTMQQNDI